MFDFIQYGAEEDAALSKAISRIRYCAVNHIVLYIMSCKMSGKCKLPPWVKEIANKNRYDTYLSAHC